MRPNPPDMQPDTRDLWGQDILQEFNNQSALSSSTALERAYEQFRSLTAEASDPVDKATWWPRRNALAVWALICLALQRTDATLHNITNCLDRKHDSWQGQLLFTLFAYQHNRETNIWPSESAPDTLLLHIPIELILDIQRELLHIICQVGLENGLSAIRSDDLDLDLPTITTNENQFSSQRIVQILNRTLSEIASADIDEALFLLRLFALIDDEPLEDSAERGFFLASYFLGYSWPPDDYRAFAYFREAAGFYMSEKDFARNRKYGHVNSYLSCLGLVMEPDLPSAGVIRWSEWLPLSHWALLCDIVDDAAKQMKSTRDALDAASNRDNRNA